MDAPGFPAAAVLQDTEPARTPGYESLVVAQSGDRDTVASGDIENGLSREGFHFFSVQGDSERGIHDKLLSLEEFLNACDGAFPFPSVDIRRSFFPSSAVPKASPRITSEPYH